MKTLIALLAMALTAWPADAEACGAIEAQAHLVSVRLSHIDLAGAEKALVPLEAAHPDCALLVLDRARIQAAKGDDAAEETFLHAIALQPEDAEGWAYLARYLLAKGENQRAEAASDRASRRDRNDPLAMAVEGQFLDMKGESQKGIALLEQAILLRPGDAEMKFQLGSIHDRGKHPKQAAQYFAETVALTPSDARAWDYLALNLEPLGEIDRARQAYIRGSAENRPGAYFDAFLPYNYGRLLMKLNELSASKEQLDRAVELTPDVRAAWYERARLNVRLNHLQQARTDAEKAASLEDPQVVIADLQVYVLLEQIYNRLGQAALAHKYAELSRVTPSPVQSELDRTH